MSVITGFLGSGKTTLLSRLLADPRMRKAAVIINEFGEVGLDHLLVTSPREDVTLFVVWLPVLLAARRSHNMLTRVSTSAGTRRVLRHL